MNPADDIPQSERRRILIEERRMRTYHGHAQHTGQDFYGGRFKQVTTTNVVGAGPISYPAQPEHSPWRRDTCPDEPPLGFDVNAQEPVGEPHEIRASTPSVISRQDGGEGTPPSSSPTAQADGDVRRAASSKIRRRF